MNAEKGHTSVIRMPNVPIPKAPTFASVMKGTTVTDSNAHVSLSLPLLSVHITLFSLLDEGDFVP